MAGQALEFSAPLTLASLYLACIGMAVPTALLLFATSKGPLEFLGAVGFFIIAFVCLGAVAALQTEFMPAASTGGASLSGQTLTFKDTAARLAMGIIPAIFLLSLVAQMELARREYEY
jgi:hypothetical protein